MARTTHGQGRGRRAWVRAAGRGFTLIELIVAIAVLAILVALAVPSFTALINGNRVTSAANEMVASLQLARMESLRRNMRVAVCQSGNATSCTNNGLWGQWITIADSDRNGTYDQVLRVSVADDVQVRPSGGISGNQNRIEFRADGLARNAAGALLDARMAVCIPTNQPAENERRVNIAFGSSVSVTRNNAGGACPAP
jgi:type IV fimbrial biogenesis protein FimT